MGGWSRALTAGFVLSLSLALVGCGKASNRVPIQGKVLYKGQPVAKGFIRFFPKENAGQTTEAAPITDGWYSSPLNRGLVPGTYRVEITAAEGDGTSGTPDTPPGAPKRGKQLISEEYNQKSTLSIEVTETGSRDFPFDLK